MNVPYINLSGQWDRERDALLPIIEKVFSSGEYIGGAEVERLEDNIAQYCGTKHCVALNSGTDALVCGLLAIGVSAGDEVITPPNSFVASTSAIVHLRAKPVFVDVLDDQNIDPEEIRKAITKKTKAIMPVHLTGRMAQMSEIEKISREYGIPVIEDAAQAFGSKFENKHAGTWGAIGAFSAHPLKNLNACGDGGFVTTNDDTVNDKLRLWRSHGLVDRNTVETFGYVSRMDALQAAILNYRLKSVDEVISLRRRNAFLYQDLLDSTNVFMPNDRDTEFNTYHTFVIQVQQRDELQKHLLSRGIQTAIHYPIPIHLQPAYKKISNGAIEHYKNCEYQAHHILTLPVHQGLKEEDIRYVAKSVNEFFG